MAHLIDKSTLVAEIESRKKYAQTLGDNAINSSMQQFYDGMKQGCVDLLSFIDTLKVKEEILDKEGKTKLMRKCVHKAYKRGYDMGVLQTTNKMNHNTKEVDLDNNGWIDCTKQMPQETKQTSDTLQGHREWTESDMVLVWDSMYGCGIDSTRNGKWRREQRGGYTGQVVHGIIAWRTIPKFNEELL